MGARIMIAVLFLLYGYIFWFQEVLPHILPFGLVYNLLPFLSGVDVDIHV